MLGLISAEEAGGLDIGSRSPGEFLVEVDNSLHLDRVGGSTNGLRLVSVIPHDWASTVHLFPACAADPRTIQPAQPYPIVLRAAVSQFVVARAVMPRTLGEATYEPVSNGTSIDITRKTNLGGNERRQRPAGDEAHDGNWVASALALPQKTRRELGGVGSTQLGRSSRCCSRWFELLKVQAENAKVRLHIVARLFPASQSNPASGDPTAHQQAKHDRQSGSL